MEIYRKVLGDDSPADVSATYHAWFANQSQIIYFGQLPLKVVSIDAGDQPKLQLEEPETQANPLPEAFSIEKKALYLKAISAEKIDPLVDYIDWNEQFQKILSKPVCKS